MLKTKVTRKPLKGAEKNDKSPTGSAAMWTEYISGTMEIRRQWQEIFNELIKDKNLEFDSIPRKVLYYNRGEGIFRKWKLNNKNICHLQTCTAIFPC